MAALTPDQRRSISDSGGYYDVDGNWVDMSDSSPSKGNGPTINIGGGGNQSQGGGGVNPWAAILATLGGGLAGHYLSGRSAENNVPPELRQMLQMSLDRQAYQNPEFQAVTQGTYQMLPGFARDGTQLSGTLSSTPPPAPTNSGGSGGGGDNQNPFTSLNPLKNPLLAGLLGKAAGDASRGEIPFKDVIDGIKRLFGGDKNLFGGKTTYNNGLPNYNPYGYGFDGLPGFNGSPNDPSGGTGRGPGMQGYWDDPYNPFTDPNFSGMPGFNGHSDPNWGNPGFGGPSDPSGGSGLGPGMDGYHGGGDTYNYGTDPGEE